MASFEKVFELLQRSMKGGSVKGVTHFAYWAAENPGEFYSLYARLLPKNLDVTSGGEGIQRAVLVMPVERIPDGEYVVVDEALERMQPVIEGEVVEGGEEEAEDWLEGIPPIPAGLIEAGVRGRKEGDAASAVVPPSDSGVA